MIQYRGPRPDGYIRITGREKDIIIRGGENIPIIEVENSIYKMPEIADAAVVGMPDPRLGERTCAFVTLNPGYEKKQKGLASPSPLGARGLLTIQSSYPPSSHTSRYNGIVFDTSLL